MKWTVVFLLGGMAPSLAVSADWKSLVNKKGEEVQMMVDLRSR